MTTESYTVHLSVEARNDRWEVTFIPCDARIAKILQDKFRPIEGVHVTVTKTTQDDIKL